MRNYYLRNNETDFCKWCKEYVREALVDVRAYESVNSGIYLILNRENYHEALVIKRQYEVLCAALLPAQRELLQKLMNSVPYDFYNHENANNYREIFSLWREICFPKNRPKIKSIDAEFLGKILREERMRAGLSSAQVSTLLNITPATLSAYETGIRTVKINTLYGMSQLYKISIDELIRKHSLK